MNLYDCLTKPFNHPWGGRVETKDGPYFHHDNGAKVLGVAHLDWVMYAEPKKIGTRIHCPQLDDRLGVWILLGLLPKLGVKIDTLLTMGEESCRSTGAWFHPEKQYNWIIEFDRAGKDIVFYQYEDFAETWENYGFKYGMGSFSDISSMDHLGCMAANLGIGYHGQHSPRCHADLTDTLYQVRHFADFWHDHKDIPFPYDPWASEKKDDDGKDWIDDLLDWDDIGFRDQWPDPLNNLQYVR